MPPESTLPRPTDAELAILRVLWDCGASTVRAVHEALESTQSTGYTTVLKLMQIMHGKGLVTRDDANKAHVYRPAVEEEAIQRNLVASLLDRAFQGSAEKLVLRALSLKPSTPEELAAIRALLDKLEDTP
ncbi:MAG: BlaI/MecI/CopY family transcriptional regulator [Rhodothermales bacterium]|nr:BlaI/MecI/CopY family transcriptional regulator [Rhodothermales bacterium]